MTKGRMANLDQIRAGPFIPPEVKKEVKRTVNVTNELTFSQDIGETNSLREIFAEIEIISKRILESNTKDLEKTFKESLPLFKPKFEKVSKTMIMLEKESLKKIDEIGFAKKIAQTEYQIYQQVKQYIKARNDLHNNISIKILEIIDNLSEYENILFGIIIKKSSQLQMAISEINVDDLVQNIVGAYQAFYCILYLLNHQESNMEKLSKLIDFGLEYSNEMDSYIDTLDILTDPEEIETLRKSEKYYNNKSKD
jgi:hypothetical protein